MGTHFDKRIRKLVYGVVANRDRAVAAWVGRFEPIVSRGLFSHHEILLDHPALLVQ